MYIYRMTTGTAMKMRRRKRRKKKRTGVSEVTRTAAYEGTEWHTSPPQCPHHPVLLHALPGTRSVLSIPHPLLKSYSPIPFPE